MTKKLTLWVIATFVLSIGLVVGLWALSKDIRDKPGSFLRQYPTHPVEPVKLIRLPAKNYYFAGATTKKIYLADTERPLDLLEIKTDLSDSTNVHLEIEGFEGSKYVRITVVVDSPYFYVMDGGIPYMYRGNISEWIGKPFMMDSVEFIDAIPLSSNSFAIRAISTKTKEYVLGKIRINPDSTAVGLNFNLLQRQFNGTFDVNGSFTFNKSLNLLTYVYFYRNQYLVMDTSLNLQGRGNTIDTFRIAQVKAAEVDSEKSIRLAAPPLITNRGHTTYKDRLFVHSLLPAKNEDMKTFNKASIIDVYSLTDYSYLFSFQVYNEYGEKLRDLKVVNDNLYALYETTIRKFDFVDYYFKDNM